MKQGVLSANAIERILASREMLLKMLVRWIGDPEEAEDILQAAYVRALEKSETVRTEDHIVRWFREVVRNLAIDRLRRRSVESRALSILARDAPEYADFSKDAGRSICECVRELLPTLRPSYREILNEVELRECTVQEAARKLRLSSGNARVRLFRAREALRKRLIEVCGACAEHHCLDCWCKRERGESSKL